MEEPKITPGLVVARYRELGIRPMRGGANLENVDGRMALREGAQGSCAIGIMAIGMACDEFEDLSKAAAVRLGLRFWPFVGGFDCPGSVPPARNHSCTLWDDDDLRSFEMGVACRLAVDAEFGDGW